MTSHTPSYELRTPSYELRSVKLPGAVMYFEGRAFARARDGAGDAAPGAAQNSHGAIYLGRRLPANFDRPLPVVLAGDVALTCWRFGWRQRLAVLFGAPVYVHQLGAPAPLSLTIK